MSLAPPHTLDQLRDVIGHCLQGARRLKLNTARNNDPCVLTLEDDSAEPWVYTAYLDSLVLSKTKPHPWMLFSHTHTLPLLVLKGSIPLAEDDFHRKSLKKLPWLPFTPWFLSVANLEFKNPCHSQADHLQSQTPGIGRGQRALSWWQVAMPWLGSTHPGCQLSYCHSLHSFHTLHLFISQSRKPILRIKQEICLLYPMVLPHHPSVPIFLGVRGKRGLVLWFTLDMISRCLQR